MPYDLNITNTNLKPADYSVMDKENVEIKKKFVSNVGEIDARLRKIQNTPSTQHYATLSHEEMCEYRRK